MVVGIPSLLDFTRLIIISRVFVRLCSGCVVWIFRLVVEYGVNNLNAVSSREVFNFLRSRLVLCLFGSLQFWSFVNDIAIAKGVCFVCSSCIGLSL